MAYIHNPPRNKFLNETRTRAAPMTQAFPANLAPPPTSRHLALPSRVIHDHDSGAYEKQRDEIP